LIKLLSIFADNLLPILLIAGIGYLAGTWLKVDPRSISRVVFYIFSPCLLFDLLISSELNGGDMLRMVAFALIYIAITGVLTWLIGRMIKLDRKMLAAVLISTITLNAGNYGLSLNLFAFKEEGLAYASLFFVTSAVVTYTAGVTVASMGNTSLLEAIKGMIKIPAIYAVGFAVLFMITKWQLPLFLERSVSLLGDASIPGMLLVLGLQLQRNHRSTNTRALVLVNGMRLFASPFLALGLATLLGLRGTAFNAGVVEASMPTAVLSTILATEYDANPVFVTTAVLSTTLLSPLTLTPLLAFLGA
jgi:predicted permease